MSADVYLTTMMMMMVVVVMMMMMMMKFQTTTAAAATSPSSHVVALSTDYHFMKSTPASTRTNCTAIFCSIIYSLQSQKKLI